MTGAEKGGLPKVQPEGLPHSSPGQSEAAEPRRDALGQACARPAAEQTG